MSKDEERDDYGKERYLIELGTLIKMLRQSKGISQLELAHRSKVSQPTIVRLEKGDFDKFLGIRLVAARLGKTIGQLDEIRKTASVGTDVVLETAFKTNWADAKKKLGLKALRGLVTFTTACELHYSEENE